MEERQILKIEEVLIKDGLYVGPTVGVSMEPMLKTHRDSVVIVKKTTRLKELDVALYKRDDKYVLHRVLKVTENGYIIRGDNTYSDEMVLEDQVIGVLTEFYRKDVHYYVDDPKYLKYVNKRLKSYKRRKFFFRVKNKLRRIIKGK